MAVHQIKLNLCSLLLMHYKAQHQTSSLFALKCSATWLNSASSDNAMKLFVLFPMNSSNHEYTFSASVTILEHMSSNIVLQYKATGYLLAMDQIGYPVTFICQSNVNVSIQFLQTTLAIMKTSKFQCITAILKSLHCPKINQRIHYNSHTSPSKFMTYQAFFIADL